MRVIYRDERYLLIQMKEVFILLESEGDRVDRRIYDNERQALEAIEKP